MLLSNFLRSVCRSINLRTLLVLISARSTLLFLRPVVDPATEQAHPARPRRCNAIVACSMTSRCTGSKLGVTRRRASCSAGDHVARIAAHAAAISAGVGSTAIQTTPWALVSCLPLPGGCPRVLCRPRALVAPVAILGAVRSSSPLPHPLGERIA
jgi:hypothetical protein